MGFEWHYIIADRTLILFKPYHPRRTLDSSCTHIPIRSNPLPSPAGEIHRFMVEFSVYVHEIGILELDAHQILDFANYF